MSEDPQQRLYLSKADFHECLVQFFRPFVSIRPIDWTCIQKSETYFAPFFKFKEFGRLYFDYIYCLFDDFRIIDKAVTDSFLWKYYRFVMKDCGFPLADPDEFQYPVNERRFAKLHYCKHIGEPKALDELLMQPILYRYPNLLAYILRFNAPSRTRNKDLPCYIKYVMSCIRKDPLLVHVDKIRWNQRDDTMGRRRQKLILMVLEFVLKVRDRVGYTGCILALRLLLFKAIPDPYVTWQEIFSFLTRRLPPSENRKLFIKSFRKSCKYYYPECVQGLRPRTLKHLAKCQVRRCLRKSLPHGVLGLGLPRELEDYIHLREKNPYRPIIGPLSSERVFDLGPVLAIQSSREPNVYLDLPRQVYDC